MNTTAVTLVSGAIILISFLFPRELEAQITSSPEMPKVTPRSPEAAAMDKFGEYPVSMFTGLPEISIPLFEVKSRDFSVPINLEYHASGIKVNEFASWAGLGWSLNTGGRISVKVMGKSDWNHTRKVLDESDIHPNISSDHLYLQQICNGTDDWDPEPDVYSYNLPGRSGRYLYNNEGNPVMIPYNGIKVGPANQSKILTDEKGNTFTYGYVDVTTAEYPSTYETERSYLITKMKDHGCTDSITFSYQALGTGMLGIEYIDYLTVDDQVTYAGCSDHRYTSGINSFFSYTITTYGDETALSQINFPTGTVKFIPSAAERQDRWNPGSGTGFKSINKIEIYSIENSATPVKTIYFYQSYFYSSSTKRLRLDSLRIVDQNSQLIERYKFDYDYSYSLPAYDSRAKDYWGYFNNRYNDMLVPQMTIEFIGDNYSSTTNQTIGTGNIVGREPDEGPNRAFVLNKITYPTGGYTTFEFETNKYLDNQTSKYAGGLRIKNIRSFNENGLCTQKTYKYGANESGYGRFNVFLSDYYFVTPSVQYQCRNYPNSCGWADPMEIKRSRIYSSNACTDLVPFDGSPVVYPIVTEYIGDETTNTGKTMYYYTDDPDIRTGFYQSSVSKTFKVSKSFRRGLLSSKMVYKKENGQFRKIYAEGNSYFAYPTEQLELSFMVSQTRVYECEIRPDYDFSEYSWCNGITFVGDNLLTSSSKYYYDMADTTKYQSVTTTYTYNSSKYTQVSKQTTNNSFGDQISNAFIYTTEDSSGYLRSMRDLNIISSPVREYQVKNQYDTLFSKKTNFEKKFWNKFYAPTSIEFRKGTSPWEKRIYFSNYDQTGNLTGAFKDKDLKSCYVYNSYNQLTAEIVNADTSSFYVNDFENSDGYASTIAKTGKKYRYSSFSRTITLKTGTYTMTYWLYSSGWTLVTSTINATNNQYQISLPAGIDDIRIYPAYALVKTYTYDPLFGITSSTDENNISTYYEYDDSGRLKRIKDQNDKVLKEYTYNIVNH